MAPAALRHRQLPQRLLGMVAALLPLCSVALAATLLPAPRGAPVYRATWFVNSVVINPACLGNRPTVIVNGGIPGPPVDVVEGTRVVITVVNRQKVPVTIHWHGILQYQSQWHDGVGGVTQCDIKQGQRFTYNFSTIGHAGSLWWHAHVKMLRGTVVGALNVRPRRGSLWGPDRIPEPVPVVGETTLFLQDWFQKSAVELEHDILGYPFKGFPLPDAFLINGRSKFACKAAPKPFTFFVKPNRWYKLRVTNAALYATFNFAVQGHNIFTYESEGGYLKPRLFQSYDIMSGQSYSFLLKTERKPAAYWVAARPRYDVEGIGLQPGLALMRYTNAAPKAIMPAWAMNKAPSVAYNPTFTANQLARTVAGKRAASWIKKVDRFMMFELNMNLQSKKYVRYSMNNVTLAMPPTPPLYLEYAGRTTREQLSFMSSIPPPGNAAAVRLDPAKQGFGMVDIPYGAVVEMVIQNHVPPGLNHPWHLHGYNFYVVAQGTGRFNPAKRASYRRNLVNPVFRNTMWLMEGGWTAVRFKADNPGVWLMHCHLEPHADGGMAVVFRVRKPGVRGGGIPPVPRDYPKC